MEKIRKGKCEATGLQLYVTPINNPFYPSIDRMDSSEGYTKDNCQLVSLMYNELKSDNDIEDVKLFAKNFVKLYEKRNKQWSCVGTI